MEKEITTKDIGRKVVYRNNNSIEEGVITSFNSSFVFVRYGSNTQSQATSKQDLEFIN